MRAFDQLIASNQADALAQMAQEPNVVRRMAGKLRDIPVARWAELATWQVAGILAVGAFAGTPLTAHADDYQPIYQPSTTAQASAPAVYATAQVPTAQNPSVYATAQTPSNNSYQPVYQQAPQPPSNPAAGLGTAVRTVVGAGIGGVIGHLFGDGNGRTAMTALGVVGGGAIGNSLGNERPVNQAQNYGQNNPNPYPQQTPTPAGGNASGPNLGTLVGGGVGALIGNQFGAGRGKTVATIVGAGVGALTGTHVENAAINARTPNYQRVLVAQDEAGACFAQWSGKIQPTQSLTSNPQADGAMRQAVVKLGAAFDSYSNEAARYRQAGENASWTVDAQQAATQHQLLNQETRTMVDAEKKYVYYRGTFMEKCNMAAERGYDVRVFNQARQLLTLDTGGYTYQNPNPSVAQTAAFGTPRRPGY